MLKFDDALMTVVENDLAAGAVPMLLGEPGIGKSSWVEALGVRNCTKVFVLQCNQLADKADLTGARLVPIEGTENYKQVFFPHADVMDAIAYAQEHPRENPILFMDEINRTTSDVTSACLSLPTARRIGNQKLPPNLRIIVAGNDRGNVTALDEASVSRFVLYRVGPDTQTYLGLDQNLNPFVRNVLTAHPETLFGKKVKSTVNPNATNNSASGQDDDDIDMDMIIDDADEMNQFATPRTITGISNWLNQFSNKQLLDLLTTTTSRDGEEISVLQEAIEGHTGRTYFSQFLVSEIATGVSTINNQANVIQLTPPQCWATFKGARDVTTLNQIISGLSDTEKSACLLYALYERADNSQYITALAPQLTRLTTDDSKTFMGLASDDNLDEANVRAFLQTNCPLSNALSMMLNLDA